MPQWENWDNLEYAEVKDLMELFALVLSIFLAILMGIYIRKNKPHITFWFFAWVIISIRTYMSILEPITGIPHALIFGFVRDILIVIADLLFLVGICYLLGLGREYKHYIPALFFFTHIGISGILYLFLDSLLLGAAFTNLFTNPVLLFLVFYFFNEGAIRSHTHSLRLISIGFLLWGIDFVIFGPLYYGAGYQFAGMCGWTIGFIARTVILGGFLLLVPTKKMV